MAYITPATLPVGVTCRELEIPDNDDCNAIVVGALYELTRKYNWEQRSGETVDDTVALFQTMFNTFMMLPECSAGGAVDYELQSEDTLISDVTTYTLSDLDLLSGRDLRIDWLMAGTSTGNRDLRIRINGLETDIYHFQETRFSLGTGYTRNVDTFWKLETAVYKTETPQDYYSNIVVESPLWKDDDRYPILSARNFNDTINSLSKCHVQSVTDLQSMTFYLSSGDIKAGSKVAVYTRG